MESGDFPGENIRLDAAQRREILERIYQEIVSVVAAYCPTLDPRQVNGYLRNIDFSHLEPPEREVFCELLPSLTAAITPPETDIKGGIWHAFDRDISAAEVQTGGIQLINEEGIPVTEEHLRSQAAVLRATTLFSVQTGGNGCRTVLEKKYRTYFAK